MALRQVFQTHALLHAGDIIFHPMPFPGVVGQVQDGVGGARVTVTRLTDRTRVEDGARSEGHLGNALGYDQLGGQAVIRQVIKDRQVGVTHEAIRGIEEFKTDRGSASVEQVFPYRAVGAAMHQSDKFEVHAFLQVLEVLFVGRGEPFLGPQYRLTSFRVESVHFDGAHCGCIVVAQDALQVGELPDALDAFIRVRAVPDQVTQAPGSIEWTGIGEHSFEGSQVGMDVRDDQGAQGLMLA